MLFRIRQLILEFLLEKEELINWYIDEDDCGYLKKKDIAEMLDWPLSVCILILEQMVARTDVTSCPWCIIQQSYKRSNFCYSCEYGRRHLLCSNNKSDYCRIKEKVIKKMRDVRGRIVCAIPGMDELSENFNKEANKILETLKNKRRGDSGTPIINEMIIEFLRSKNVLIESSLRLVGYKEPIYITEEDLSEISGLVLSKGIKILESVAHKSGFWTDPEICPWCILYNGNNCSGCNYGQRHGKCSLSTSTYKKISRVGYSLFTKSIACVPNMQGLADEFREDARKVLKAIENIDVHSITNKGNLK